MIDFMANWVWSKCMHQFEGECDKICLFVCLSLISQLLSYVGAPFIIYI